MEIDRYRLSQVGDAVLAIGASAVGGIVEVGRTIHRQLEELVVALGGVEVDELQKR